jgi:RNA-directed DNA polymerase
VNTDAPTESDTMWAERVLEIQTKLHRWAGEDHSRRFDDVFNLVAGPAFLVVAWERVAAMPGHAPLGSTG